MTAVDHAELKRLEGDAVEPIERAIKALKRDIAAIQDAKKRGGSGASITDCINRLPEIVRWLESGLFDVEAAFEQYEDAAEALLSEIEGLKAERDEAGVAKIASEAIDWISDLDNTLTEDRVVVGAARKVAVRLRSRLQSLRTQAPDSWRPDRCDVEETIHAWLRDHAGNAIKMTMTPAIRDALADAILALRPQTAESGK